jgi:diguanylate cyclase (GGDEF)-like protein
MTLFRALQARVIAARHAALFGIVAVVAFALVPLPPAEEHTGALVAAGALTAALAAASLVAPWSRLPSWAKAVPPLAYLVVVAILRQAEGGAGSGYAPLAFLPIVWLALYGSRVQLLWGAAAATAVFMIPIVAVGPPDYPASEWRHVVILGVVGPLIGLTIQRLVARLRANERELATMARLVRDLAKASDPRRTICEAACETGGASFALLYENDDAGQLVTTAAAGEGAASEPSGAAAAFASGERRFVPDAAASTGAETVLYEPVVRDSQVVGVLTLGWLRRVDALDDRAVGTIGVLAAEAAFAIEHGDLVADLRELATSDPLTGLLNRRAWEDELPREIARAEREDAELSIALLDVDNFKRYNDSQGHQAGDRLLKEATAAWRNSLRRIDRLARLGGDEFGLLLPRCNASQAEEVLDRVRDATPSEHSCSIGVAQWKPGESADELVARADTALYEAKAAGRNRLSFSDPQRLW